MKRETLLKNALLSALLLLIAAISVFVLAQKTSSNETFAATLASLDEKTKNVLQLSASSALISTGISALPGDTASPIAGKLADFTGYFLLILTVLYTEKNLLTILGVAVFRFIIPIACVLCIFALFSGSQVLRRVAAKIAIFGLAVFIAIPLSLRVSDMVYENHRDIVETALQESDEMSAESAQISNESGSNGVLSLLKKTGQTISGVLDKGAQIINRFVESIAVFIVTSCIIPILVLAFVLWLIKLLFGVKISLPKGKKQPEKEPAEE